MIGTRRVCYLGDVIGDVESNDVGGDGAAQRRGVINVPKGAVMMGLGPEDERRVWDSPGERRHGEERPRPAWDKPESCARRGRSGGGGRRPRRHVPSRGRCSPLSLSTDAMRRGESWRRRDELRPTVE
jgi:hypothetical protein